MQLTIEQALIRAVDAHKSGRLPEAENLYRAILQVAPGNGDANHNLGLLALGAGKPDAALPLLKTALDGQPQQAQFWASYVRALAMAGRMEDAARYRALAAERGVPVEKPEGIERGFASTSSQRAVSAQPESGPTKAEIDRLVAEFNRSSDATAETLARDMAANYPDTHLGWLLSGLIAYRGGRLAEALPMMERAVELAPSNPDARNNLGVALTQAGRLDEAELHLRAAVRLDANFVEARSNLGDLLRLRGRFDEAGTCLREALRIDPEHVGTCHNLGNLFLDLGQLALAEDCFRKVLARNAKHAGAHGSLGKALRELGRFAEAEAACRQAVALEPSSVYTLMNLGDVLRDSDRPKEAERVYLSVLQIDAASPMAYNNLGIALRKQGRLKEAEAAFRSSVKFAPDHALPYSNLGNALGDQGKLAEAETFYREALRLQPDNFDAWSCLLFSLNYSDGRTAEERLREARRFGALASAHAGGAYASWRCAPNPDRLRIGLVSGDIHSHPVGYFLEGLLARVSTRQIEFIAFATGPKADELTLRVKPFFKEWVPLHGLNDKDAARAIHERAPHILIDLAGHTADNRLPLFVYRAAPLQVSWLGYFATTGLPEMDYLLASRYTVPPGEEGQFTEKVWRMPDTTLCFTAPQAEVAVSPLPALEQGFVTFGCFNNLSKMNAQVVAAWSALLKRMPSAKLFLKANQLGDPGVAADVLAAFGAHGIAGERLILEGHSGRAQYLAAYRRVDIALDPFPYPGGTTSVEALWMGVPVLTLKGARLISHQGEAIAHNAGLSDWIADDIEDYVAKAVRFASNQEALADLRGRLRKQFLDSPLADAARFARHFEDAMWGMWRERELQ